ncbi:VOC family protein [Sneathiella sp.]|uniref:VOC family protein n=1 Tax=Sneathiella sp. TaxID=1964365 RepID=UPI00262A3621|nr:VOC family protein [Sneathiella sp.]MDF2368257.1 VOC family protein [Sneathiella sp.]
MSPNNYVRLRQICLAAADITETERVFSHVLGLDVCHRSVLDNFGLENIMYAINGCFLEIVAPTKENTAVDRFLARNNGRGGYMAIFDCADMERHKSLAEEAGVDPIYERRNEKADLLQLNPKQTGATMMEFDHHHGDDSMLGHYEWAGDEWHQYVSTEVTGDILGIEITSPDAEARAKLWGHICDRPVGKQDGICEIDLDYGYLRFVDTAGSGPELFTAIDLTARDPEAMKERAQKAGCAITPAGFDFCGVEFRITSAD